jgi:hypothetical protein
MSSLLCLIMSQFIRHIAICFRKGRVFVVLRVANNRPCLKNIRLSNRSVLRICTRTYPSTKIPYIYYTRSPSGRPHEFRFSRGYRCTVTSPQLLCLSIIGASPMATGRKLRLVVISVRFSRHPQLAG